MRPAFNVITPLAALLLLAFLLPACSGRGGGSVHTPPEQILYDQSTPLYLELTANGHAPIGRKLSRRYTNVCLHYKPQNATAFTTISAHIEKQKRHYLLISFELPPLTPADGAYVDYYMDMKLDGVYCQKESVRVPLSASPAIHYEDNRVPTVFRTGDLFHAM